MPEKSPVPMERIERAILLLRGQKVLLDADLAELYGVETKALFLARYIEKFGTGTLMMIRECLAHNLPEPDFAQRGGEFTITLWRDWLTDGVLAGFHLHDRQTKAVSHVKRTGRISNSEYQQLTGAARKTAARDLDDLVEKGIFVRLGEKRGIHYVQTGRK